MHPPAPLPNPLILFNNHFVGYRRHYPYRTRLAIARDLGYQGYEFHPIEPDDKAQWDEAAAAFAHSGLPLTGMYVIVHGVTDDEADDADNQVARLERILDRLADMAPRAFLNLALGGNPTPVRAFHEAGSAGAQERHWERATQLVAAADRMLAERNLTGNLYNHVWFMSDTPQTNLRLLELAQARVLRPGLASFHAHFHQGVPDPAPLLDLPGMERLGYVALLNALPAPEPFRTVPIDEGHIDMAGLLAELWQRDYSGPLVTQAYDLGGDPYVSARRSKDYIVSIWERFERNPELNPVLWR